MNQLQVFDNPPDSPWPRNAVTKADPLGRAAGGSAREMEFKLAVPDSAIARTQDRLSKDGPVMTTLLHAQYFDTPDDRLAGAGFSLRLRQENESWTQTLKRTDTHSNLDRSEHEVHLRLADGVPATVDLWRHAGTVAGRALFDVLGMEGTTASESPQLAMRYSARVMRQSVTVDHRGSRIEVSFDQGHVDAGNRSLPICELELELKAGLATNLSHFAKSWLRDGLRIEAESKAQRGLRLLHQLPVSEPQKAETPAPAPGASADAFARSVVAACLGQILPNMAIVASGAGTDDHVHQLRIGIRRLRTALRELPSLSDSLPTKIKAALREVFRLLGEHRDNETVMASYKPKLLAAGAKSVGWADPEVNQKVDLVGAVSGRKFQMALLKAAAYAADRSGDTAGGSKRLRRKVEPRLQQLHGQVTRRGRQFTKLPEVEQHDLRKRLKRLRYLSEFVEPIYGNSTVQSYLDELKPAQDALGLHNDGVVARTLAVESSKRDPDARLLPSG